MRTLWSWVKVGRKELLDPAEHLDHRLAVVEVVLETLEKHQLAALAGTAQGGVHPLRMQHPDVDVAGAVEEQHGSRDPIHVLERRARPYMRALTDELPDQPVVGEALGLLPQQSEIGDRRDRDHRLEESRLD